MVRLLQQYNAKESSACKLSIVFAWLSRKEREKCANKNTQLHFSAPDLTRDGRENQLFALFAEARDLVRDLSHSLEAIPASSAAASSASRLAQTAADEQLMSATGSLLSSALLEVSRPFRAGKPPTASQFEQLK